MSNYQFLQYICIEYAKHLNLKYKTAYLDLNKVYSFSIYELDNLFTNENRIALAPSCVRLKREKIISTVKEYAKKDYQDPTKLVVSRFKQLLYSCFDSVAKQSMQ